ncbi:hypothetical protein QFC22_001553 [Naganishia vaughanmartiniae]|uniref:Uncharacterized protein n=1 Tax=Naganishia vaughanmartiniae TaxID=1424756 RepID=A0ACC2XH55_9TREE|nr:hypothetical protein QFC22_001553 [Naganishia vaughanmartiniae]
MSPQSAKQATPPTAEKRGSKRVAPAASVSPSRSKPEEEEEIVIIDTATAAQVPPAKKARTSTTTAATSGTASSSSVTKGKPVQNGKTGTVAGKKDNTSTGGGVKKTIFMPGFGVKPSATPAIPAKLAETLSIPLPSTSSRASISATDGTSTTAATLKRDFVDALPEDLKELLQMEIETMGDDWFVALRGEFIKPYFREDDGQAHGLAFSVRKGIRTPPSLRNIYKELGEEVGAFTPPSHGYVSVERAFDELGKAGCAVTQHLSNHRLAPTGSEEGAQGVVFLAWGAPAGKLCVGISEVRAPMSLPTVFIAQELQPADISVCARAPQKSHHVLRSAHPSPLAASRGFFGNKHFVQCNEWLESKYGVGKGIDWTSVMRD